MQIYDRLNIAKSKPKFNYKFTTSSIEERDKLLKLRDKHNLCIFVIKSVETSVAEYLKRKNYIATIHSINLIDDEVHVTAFKNNDHQTIIIKKSDLMLTGKETYEFLIGCTEEPKKVEKEYTKRVKVSLKKDNVIYIGK